MITLITVVGETASGKSALALEIAQQFNGEIICADSRTIYRGMTVGTAKPTTEEQTLIPHYGLDIVDPDENFNASQFKNLAQASITDILSRGKLPILVGGTGLYIDAVLYDYQFRQPPAPDERIRLENMSVEELQNEIIKKGFVMPENVQNKRHLMRLLESDGVVATRGKLRSETLILGCSATRLELQNRILLRVRKMLDTGLEFEVKNLINEYGWHAIGMNAIGYREWKQYLDGTQNVDQVVAQIVKDTLNLAKRQRTWFKRNESVQWLDHRSNAVEIITTLLNK